MDYVTRIRNLREDSDLTQQDIAEYLGTSQTMYARYERGANEMPIRHLIRLSQYYNVSLDYLCGLSDIKQLIYSNDYTLYMSYFVYIIHFQVI